MAKYVYLFGAGKTEGSAKMKDLLGGKGANLAEMAALGIPVPPGFTITTEVCRYYYKNGGKYPEGLTEQVRQGMRFLEEATGRKFGDPENPLLVSVRSGAPVSMPGMMDTILNLGLNDKSVEGLASRTSPRFAYDAYRRLLSMYGSVVLGIKDEVDPFGEAMEELKRERKASSDLDLTAEDFRELVARYKEIIRRAGKNFPQDPWEQLWGAIEAVVRSWMNERAKGLSPALPHSRGDGHSCQRPGHGFREPREPLGHRRLLHPGSRHRRKPALWGIPPQRSRRGCGGRDPHPKPDFQERQNRSLPNFPRRGHARGLPGTP
jgi:hypothetical protein